MSLQWYRRPRLVILNSRTSILEAARAIEQNRIGAIVVQDKGSVVGIVTDRDLAVRALGRALDPGTTSLAEIMTEEPVTLTPADDRVDAIRLMREHNIRRIPLVEAEQVVGIVTLDDLLLDEAAPVEELAAVVEAQIGAGGPADSCRSPTRRRSAARAEASFRRLLRQVRWDADLDNIDQAETALRVVLQLLTRRLTPEEAGDLVAQLPSLLQPELQSMPPGPDKTITRESIEAALAERLDVDGTRAAKMLVAVGNTLARNVSPGEMEDVRSQLPRELRSVFADAPPPG